MSGHSSVTNSAWPPQQMSGHPRVDAFLRSGDVRHERRDDPRDNRYLSQAEAIKLMNMHNVAASQNNYLDHGTDMQKYLLRCLPKSTGCKWKNKKEMTGTGAKEWCSKITTGKHLIGIVVTHQGRRKLDDAPVAIVAQRLPLSSVAAQPPTTMSSVATPFVASMTTQPSLVAAQPPPPTAHAIATPAPVDQIDWLVKKIKAAEKLGDMSMARRLKRKLEDC